jgi:hypothetical protein
MDPEATAATKERHRSELLFISCGCMKRIFYVVVLVGLKREKLFVSTHIIVIVALHTFTIPPNTLYSRQSILTTKCCQHLLLESNALPTANSCLPPWKPFSPTAFSKSLKTHMAPVSWISFFVRQRRQITNHRHLHEP